MKIMVVNVFFAPYSYGGATMVAERTAVHLREMGHEVLVVTGSFSPEIGDLRLLRYEALGLPVLAFAGRAGAYENKVVGRRFRELLAAVRPDVVLFHSIQGLGTDVVKVTQDLGIANVVFLHDAWWLCERQFMVRANGQWCGQDWIDPQVCDGCAWDHKLHRDRQKRSSELLNACDLVLAPSRFWADLMVRSGLRADRVGVCKNGVQFPAGGFQARSLANRDIRFGFVGGTSVIKGYGQLRRALAELDRSDYELVAFDAEALLGRSGFTARDWPITGTLRIAPGYTSDTMDEAFAGIDVLLFPSQTRESFGLTLREAMVRGVWPVTTDGGGQAEDIRPGVNGTLIPLTSDHRPLREALERILADRDRHTLKESDVAEVHSFHDQAAELAQNLAGVVATRAAATTGVDSSSRRG